MNDDKEPIERELEQALAVDPSPDLQARIRRRVAGIPVRPKQPLWLVPAVGLLAAAAMVIAVVALRPQEAPPSAIVTPEMPVVAPVAPSVVKVMPPVSGPRPKPDVPERRVRFQQETVLIPTQTTSTPSSAFSAALEPLKLAPLPTPELKMNPLPTMALRPMAKLETFSIEPFTLKTQEPGVNE